MRDREEEARRGKKLCGSKKKNVKEFRVGDKVEITEDGQFKGVKGIVIRASGDNTYDIKTNLWGVQMFIGEDLKSI
jgi:transcription antitermination factor NusG